MTNDIKAKKWPAKLWTRGYKREADCIYQEGRAQPRVLVDPARMLTAAEANETVDRIVTCVNALAGIEDVETFLERACSALHGLPAIEAAAEVRGAQAMRERIDAELLAQGHTIAAEIVRFFSIEPTAAEGRRDDG